MTKKNFLLLGCVIFAACFGLRMMTTKLNSASTTSKLPVPLIGKPYTVQQLLNIINKNNPAGTSNFIVPMNGSSVVMNSDCWSLAGRKITNLTGSASVPRAGLGGIIDSNKETTVMLKADPTLINHLALDGRLGAAKDKYAKILLYFTIAGYRFYINDPFPGRVIAGRMSQAASIVNKWNV